MGGKMDTFAELCRAMSKEKHILTFEDIAKAGVSGALIGRKSGVPGGEVMGATLSVSLAAGQCVVESTKDLLTEHAKKHNTNRPLS